MYIRQTEFSTDIYPFSDTEDEAMFRRAISVSSGIVHWQGRAWTRGEVAEYLAKLQAGFDEAFKIVANADAGGEE